MTGPLPLVHGFGAAPSSNGAHMLGWWLGETGDRWERAAQALGVRSGWLEDVLTGRVVPYGEMANSIAGYTQGRVPAEEWDRGCSLDWGDKPLGWAGPPSRYPPAHPDSGR